jgi:hypothetical protein
MKDNVPLNNSWAQRLNYTKKFVKILRIFRGLGLKTLALLALLIYWAIMILATFSQ